MARAKVFDLMIDSRLFGESLSDFVKAHFNSLKAFKVGEIAHLWKLAKGRAESLAKF